jgi:hypothetical protein
MLTEFASDKIYDPVASVTTMLVLVTDISS